MHLPLLISLKQTTLVSFPFFLEDIFTYAERIPEITLLPILNFDFFFKLIANNVHTRHEQNDILKHIQIMKWLILIY